MDNCSFLHAQGEIVVMFGENLYINDIVLSSVIFFSFRVNLKFEHTHSYKSGKGFCKCLVFPDLLSDIPCLRDTREVLFDAHNALCPTLFFQFVWGRV